jgi:hypothetical protein
MSEPTAILEPRQHAIGQREVAKTVPEPGPRAKVTKRVRRTNVVTMAAGEAMGPVSDPLRDEINVDNPSQSLTITAGPVERCTYPNYNCMQCVNTNQPDSFCHASTRNIPEVGDWLIVLARPDKPLHCVGASIITTLTQTHTNEQQFSGDGKSTQNIQTNSTIQTITRPYTNANKPTHT